MEKFRSDIVGVLFTLAVGIISLATVVIVPEMAEVAFVLLVAIFLGIIAYWVSDYIVEYAKAKLSQIEQNSEEITNIKKELEKISGKLNFHFEIAKLKARIDTMSKERRRKGAIDPRLVVAIIILIFLVLYLRALGII